MIFYYKFAIFKKDQIKNMNFEAGFEFIIFLILFGIINYLMMLRRYENDLMKRKIFQRNKISVLYPKGTFINL
ncbi:Conserved hypothetical protein [Prochlorococcus marinus str. MIT 9515]|uniref:Uncharacterized protein n=1 Tax=Prochlorococcus marinus (strain MIT 9515) TaxID=167542 RepID=A2BUY5_PROM5|nr:Conserved hypothetical protein [Prochlorococcus marinus str. MIT 9515]